MGVGVFLAVGAVGGGCWVVVVVRSGYESGHSEVTPGGVRWVGNEEELGKVVVGGGSVYVVWWVEGVWWV